MALLLTLALLGSMVAVQGAPATVRVYGERYRAPKATKEYMRTYVVIPKEHDSSTKPVAVGVELTLGFISKAESLPGMVSFLIPTGPNTTFNYTGTEGNLGFPCVGTNPFKFLYWGYAVNGHPPAVVYGNPHFDLHFMFHSEEDWWTKWYPPSAHGPCFGADNATFYRALQPIPADCYPGGGQGTIMQDGFVWGMGNHLVNSSAAEWVPEPHLFYHTMIYGQDGDQDGGQISYFEAMVAKAFMLKKGVKSCNTLWGKPKVYNTERDVPSEYCITRRSRTVEVEFRKFATAPGGCKTINSPLVGYYGANLPPPPPGCSVPQKP